MPRSADHRQACTELAKLPPEALQAVTVRLAAGLLMDVHRWAEQKKVDLAAAIRELIALGLDTAGRPGAASVDRKELKKWGKPVEQAMVAGQSPLQPFLGEGKPNLDLLPVILASLDYEVLFQRVKERQGQVEPRIERIWDGMKRDALPHVRPLMAALDNLEAHFRARKKVYWLEEPEGDIGIIHWLLSDTVMRVLDQPTSDDADIELVRQLITARYLVANHPDSPWDHLWDG